MSHKWFFDEAVTSARTPLTFSTRKRRASETPRQKHDDTSSQEPTAIEKRQDESNLHRDPLANRTFPGNRSIGIRGLSLLWLEEMGLWERRAQPSLGSGGPPAWKNLEKPAAAVVVAVVEPKWALVSDEVGRWSTRTGRGWSEWTLWLLRGPSNEGTPRSR